MTTDNAKPKSASPPYVSFVTFKSMVRGLNQGGHVPSRLDNSVFPSMSGSARQQLFKAFRFFELVDDDGNTSALLVNLATGSDADLKAKLLGLVENYYSPNTLKALAGGTSQQLKESFGEIGGIAVPACRFLLAIAKEVGIKVSPHIKKVPGLPPKPRKRKEESEDIVDDEADSNGDAAGAPGTSIPLSILGKMPTFDPKWDKETISNWLSVMKDVAAMAGKGSS